MGYLRKVEARTPHDLAIVQIKAIKLMAWCLALVALQGIATLVFQDMLGIPRFDGVVAMFGTDEPYPIGLTWQSLILNFFVEIIDLSIMGHASVAVARMAGFNLLRNTYRPLEATSIAEFWNRYFYYFKELLVEFFFMPTFLRYFKKHPTLRIVFATFMAAGVGNWLFHLIRDIHFVAQIGWQNTLAGFQIYAVYCLILAAGIAVSQVRKKVQHSGLLRGKIIPALCVMSFFCLIQVFDYTPANSSMTLSDHLRLLFYLFGA